MPQVLKGYRIVDFTHVLSGPIATNFLTLMGADVIKIESGIGDTMRNYSGRSTDGMGASFVAVNSGKRSIVLDLKKEEHLEVARRLIAKADVVAENFRPGVIDRLGLGFDACRKIKTDIVFCSVSGFGQTGPLKFNPAIDQIIQSMSGLMNLSGEPGSGPTRIGFPVVDTYTGLLAAFAMVCALLQRERTGEGQYIDVAMFDASMVLMISMLGPYLVAGDKPAKQGNRGYSMSPTADTFKTAKGEITLGAVRQQQFEGICKVINRPDLVADPRFADRKLRFQHGDALQAEITRELMKRPAEVWEPLLNDAGVAAGVVRDMSDAVALDHFDERDIKIPIKVPGIPNGDVHILNAGFRYAHDAPGHQRSPPRLGEHTREVLLELGYPPGKIDEIERGNRSALKMK
ncbi:MAG: CoA transferase [Betaproteobacteria bacterium]|nr:CoA transferase [Betaproteobacteria bacterium]